MSKNPKLTELEKRREKLVVSTIMDIKLLKCPADCTRDFKKLDKFLDDVEKTVNKLIRGC